MYTYVCISYIGSGRNDGSGRLFATAKMQQSTFVSQFHVTSLVSGAIENHRDLITCVCACARTRAYVRAQARGAQSWCSAAAVLSSDPSVSGRQGCGWRLVVRTPFRNEPRNTMQAKK